MAKGTRKRSMALVDSVHSLEQALELGVVFFTAPKLCHKCGTSIRLVVKEYKYGSYSHRCRQCCLNISSKRYEKTKHKPEDYNTDKHRSVVARLLYR
jgi:hypothetical protein